MAARVVVLVGVLVASALAGCLGADSEKSSIDPTVRKIAGARGLPVPPCEYRFDGDYSQVCADGVFAELPFVRTHLPSHLDGADIEVGYWLPDVPAGTQVPIILMASPYYGNLGEEMSKKSGYLLMLVNNFVPHGYAVAGVSVRGTGDSGGCMDLMGAKELADLDQAVTWLGEQPWSSGAIGMTGLSYDGSTPWSAAAMGNKYLKTIVPISGVPDVYGLMFRNGSAEDRGPILLNAIYYAFFARTDPVASERAAVHFAQGVVCPESWEGLAAAMYSGATGARDPNGWWAERNRKPLVEENYKGSILSIQGLQDWNVDPSQVIPWVQELNQSGLFAHQILGQWGHSFPDTNNPANQRWDWAQILLNWFDYHLKGMTTVDLGPAVQVEDQTQQWRFEDDFPPRDATWVTYHLGTDQKLALEPGAHGAVQLTPVSLAERAFSVVEEETGQDPRGQFRSLPGYAADFTTPPLEEDLRISGLPRLHVTAQPHGPTGHLAGWLYDVDEKGEESGIGWTSINLWFADGTETMRPVTPNAEILAKMQFEPLDAYVAAGHQLRVRVWEYSDGDRIPAIPPEPVTIHFGGSYTSVLELPLVERAPEVFFAPPRAPEE